MIVLGSTGSIGQGALDIARRFDIKIRALAANKSVDLLNKQIQIHRPKCVFIAQSGLKNSVSACGARVFSGDLGEFLRACREDSSVGIGQNAGVVVNALVGSAGLLPSIMSQKLGFKLALANKESLVAAGKFLKCDEIIPIDSEHFGLRFLLKNSFLPYKRLIITASGGAFRNLAASELARVSPADALRHPTWQMGAKITIDSATMANKLFEIIEAYHLFNRPGVLYDALIEPSSAVHAIIEFADGSTSAHISRTDMHLAIAHAISEACGRGEIVKDEIIAPLDIFSLNGLNFSQIDTQKYPIFGLKNELLKNPDLGCVINAANEVMVGRFLTRKCGFLDISGAVLRACERFSGIKISSADEVIAVDKEVREYVKNAKF